MKFALERPAEILKGKVGRDGFSPVILEGEYDTFKYPFPYTKEDLVLLCTGQLGWYRGR